MNTSEKMNARIVDILGNQDEAQVSVKTLVQSLIDTKDSNKNEDQGKFVSLLKGLAFSEDPLSDQVMIKLMKMFNEENFGEFLK